MNLSKINRILLTILLVILPFHTFAVTSIDHFLFSAHDGIPMMLSAWKEIVIALFSLIFLALLITKKIPFPKFDTLDILIIIYVLWSLITGFVRWGDDIARIAWGAKYSLTFPIFFLLVRHFPLSVKHKDTILKGVIISASIVIFFGVLQKILPPDFLSHFGYSGIPSTFDPHATTAYCQQISFTDICRLQSFLSGPNQLGAYLLFALPLLFFVTYHQFRKKKEQRKNAPLRAFGATFFVLGLICLLFTYSRSAWGGFLVSSAVGFWILFSRYKWFLPFVITCIISGIVVLAGVLMSIPRPYSATCESYNSYAHQQQARQHGMITRNFCKIIYRPSSSQGHFERTRDGLLHIAQHPLGTGLGDSGPASARFYDNKIGFIPESWYLQVGIDTGWFGLGLFISILFLLGRKLALAKKWQTNALLCGLIGISIVTLKLHAWESATLALSFWGLCGVYLSPEKKNPSFWQKLRTFFSKN